MSSVAILAALAAVAPLDAAGLTLAGAGHFWPLVDVLEDALANGGVPGKAAAPPVSKHLDHSLRAADATGWPLKACLAGGCLAGLAASGALMWARGPCGAEEGKAAEKPEKLPDWHPAAPTALEAAASLPEGAGPSLRERVEAAAILIVWMVLSPAFTLLNKWCFTEGGFPFPVTLAALHMGSCFVLFGAVSWLPRGVRARVMPDVDTWIPWDVFLKSFVPAAGLMAVSLCFGNLALLHSSVIFVQLIKPFNVVITSVAAFAFGLEVPSLTHLVTVTIVALGVFVAMSGGTEFSQIGLLCQLMSSSAEGLRLVVLQGLMQTTLKLDPVTTIYRFAPLACLVLILVSCVLEDPLELSHVRAPGVILINCMAAVILNVLIGLVVSRTSAVVSILAGVAKDIGTIFAASAIFVRPVAPTDMAGYSMSLAGMCMFKVYKDRQPLFVKYGLIGGWKKALSSSFSSAS